MMRSLVLVLAVAAGAPAQAQAPAADDTWGVAPEARDDRFSNPKSKLYAGPNGWYNFGEVRAEVANAAKTRYAYKTGLNFNSTPNAYFFADNGQKRVAQLDFGTERPPVGTYEAGNKADAKQKKVRISFADVSDNKILEWVSADKAGTVTVSLVNGFLYFKRRNLKLGPMGMGNKGDLKQPMTLGFEGAVSPP